MEIILELTMLGLFLCVLFCLFFFVSGAIRRSPSASISLGIPFSIICVYFLLYALECPFFLYGVYLELAGLSSLIGSILGAVTKPNDQRLQRMASVALSATLLKLIVTLIYWYEAPSLPVILLKISVIPLVHSAVLIMLFIVLYFLLQSTGNTVFIFFQMLLTLALAFFITKTYYLSHYEAGFSGHILIFFSALAAFGLFIVLCTKRLSKRIGHMRTKALTALAMATLLHFILEPLINWFYTQLSLFDFVAVICWGMIGYRSGELGILHVRPNFVEEGFVSKVQAIAVYTFAFHITIDVLRSGGVRAGTTPIELIAMLGAITLAFGALAQVFMERAFHDHRTNTVM
jgi:hypothetical protein